MSTLWFVLVAFMIMMYVILDGFDLGAGAVHLYVARTDTERQMVIRSIGPVWDGNEVWLLAGGGSLFLAFPLLYASSFSGFYLPLMIVLWLLILRAVGLELRAHLDSPVWRSFWDVVFSGASLLLAVFFGAALGNVVRGVPLDGSGYFFAPLWTDFGVSGPRVGILDWYTVIVGVTALLALANHGSLWVAGKTEGDVNARARNVVLRLWAPLALMVIVTTIATFSIQPHVPERIFGNPWTLLFPLLAISGLTAMLVFTSRDQVQKAFIGSCLFLAGMLLSAVMGLYPNVLPSIADPANSLTIHNAAADAYALRVALVWWIPGMLLAGSYTVFAYRRFAGKVRLEAGGY
jgi:cytochrome d ubiquinol oxidase subunit II